MNVLGISSTPRKNGNSEILMRHALQPFERQGWQENRLKQAEILGINVLDIAEKLFK